MAVAVLAGPLGWLHSVAFVAWASLYANIASDWSAGEGADDRPVLERLDRLDRRLNKCPKLGRSSLPQRRRRTRNGPRSLR